MLGPSAPRRTGRRRSSRGRHAGSGCTVSCASLVLAGMCELQPAWLWRRSGQLYALLVDNCWGRRGVIVDTHTGAAIDMVRIDGFAGRVGIPDCCISISFWCSYIAVSRLNKLTALRSSAGELHLAGPASTRSYGTCRPTTSMLQLACSLGRCRKGLAVGQRPGAGAKRRGRIREAEARRRRVYDIDLMSLSCRCILSEHADKLAALRSHEG